MAKVVKHISLVGGVALLLDNGMVEVLGTASYLRMAADSLSYQDGIVDISNTSMDKYGISYPLLYGIWWTQDGKRWYRQNWETLEEKDVGAVTGVVVDLYTEYIKDAPELICTPDENGILRTKEGVALRPLPQGEASVKCLQFLPTTAWICLTKSGNVYVLIHEERGPIWKRPWLFEHRVKDMFYGDGGIVLLMSNGKLFSTVQDIPEYLQYHTNET